MSLNLDKNKIIEEFNNALALQDLENLRLKYLGKKGLISIEMKSLASLSIDKETPLSSNCASISIINLSTIDKTIFFDK